MPPCYSCPLPEEIAAYPRLRRLRRYLDRHARECRYCAPTIARRRDAFRAGVLLRLLLWGAVAVAIGALL